MTRPLSARLVLLAAAAALAAAMVFAMVVAEQRDIDARPAQGVGAGASHLRVDVPRAAPPERVRAVRVRVTR